MAPPNNDTVSPAAPAAAAAPRGLPETPPATATVTPATAAREAASNRRKGPFDDDKAYKVVLTVKRGDIAGNPRRGLKKTLTVVASEGFAAFYDKCIKHVTTSPEHMNSTLINDFLYFRRTKTCPQRAYVPLTSNNFMQLLTKRWNSISGPDLHNWEAAGQTPEEAFFFEVFLYTNKQDKIPGTNAGSPTVDRAAAEINDINREKDAESGRSTGHHRTLPHATTFTQVPQNNTTRPAQQFNSSRNHVPAYYAHPEDPTTREIKVRINGTWLAIHVDVDSLRRAIGLPNYNFDQNSSYHYPGYVPPAGAGVAGMYYGPTATAGVAAGGAPRRAPPAPPVADATRRAPPAPPVADATRRAPPAPPVADATRRAPPSPPVADATRRAPPTAAAVPSPAAANAASPRRRTRRR